MPVIGADRLTLLDHMKRLDPNGAVAKIVEVLSQRNAFVAETPFKEANLPTGEQVTFRTALPSTSFRRINEGAVRTKSRTAQFVEVCGMFGQTVEVDEQLVKLGGPDVLLSEEVAHVASLANFAEQQMFTGALTGTGGNPAGFIGLAPRFSSTTQEMGGSQVVLPGGSPSGADQTSIWLVGFGPNSVYGIFPKGSMGGMERAPFGGDGIDRINDASGNPFRAYVIDWIWKMGLVVKDYRYVARIPNIDLSALSATGDLIIPAMIRAYGQVQSDDRSVKWVWFMNQTVKTFLHLQGRNETKGSTLETTMVEGRPVTTLMGIPIRVTDALLNNEAVVS